MVIHFNTFKSRISALLLISIVVSFLGGKDAITASTVFNQLDLDNELTLKILDKTNKKDIYFFPVMNFQGVLLSSGDTIELKVSKGNFDRCSIGEEVTIYRTPNNDYMTAYQIKNQKLIKIQGYSFSFVFIPTIIFVLTGIICFYFLIIKKPVIIK